MLIHFNSHIHALVPCGIFSKTGEFTEAGKIPGDRLVKIWQENVFGLLLDKGKIGPDIVQNMKAWEHSGFMLRIRLRTLRASLRSVFSAHPWAPNQR